MARSSNLQGNFLGGEISLLAQGRVDDPRLAIALNKCLNHIATEEGALVRRPGTMRIAPTYNRAKPKYLKFISAAACPFCLEMTPLAMRMLDGAGFVFSNDPRTVSTSSLSAGKIVLGLDASHGWSVGDQFMVNLTGVSDEGGCRGRVFTAVATTSGSTLSLQDDQSLPLTITGFTTNVSLVGAKVYRIKRFTTTYSATDIPNLRLIQATLNGIILASDVAPQVITVDEPVAAHDANFTFGALGFIDGPFLDNQTQTLSLSALSGAGVVATAGSAAFASTDVGRQIRLFSQPAAFNPASTYAAGNTVTDTSGDWWVSLISGNIGVTPGQDTIIGGITQSPWAAAATAGSWAWGTITAYISATQVTITIDSSIPGMVLQTANGTTMSAWRLGVFSATSGYPTCGAYFEGRLYFAGAVPNRFDGSAPNGLNALAATVLFSPTDPYGNVNDDSAIAEVLNSKTVNLITWMEPDAQGLLGGTGSGEWLISASVQGDPITPTTIQAHQVTSYRSENIEPVRAPMALIYPQSYGRRVLEYLADAFSQRFTGEPLNENARHMTTSGIARIDYQDEPIPVVWAVTNAGQLIGCTYRRRSKFVTENPVFNAWAQHKHGGGLVTDLCVVPAQTGLADRVYLAVQDPGGYFNELLQPCVEVNPLVSARDGWFVDSSPGSTITPVGKCGFLYPSGGYRITSAFTPGDWSDVSGMPVGPTLNSGDTLPTPGGVAFNVLNNGCYLNGYSALANFCAPHNITGKLTLSVWLWVVADGGALMNTNMAGSGFTFEQNPILTQGIGPPELTWSIAHNGTLVPFSDINGAGLATGPGGGGSWVNLLLSWTDGTFTGGAHSCAFVNDTNLGALSTMPFVSNSQGMTSLSTASLVFGGCRQSAMTPDGGHFQPSDFFGAQIPVNGFGLTAGIAELWMSFDHALDFNVAGNRRLFNAVNLASSQWAPVKLGTHGELPLGGTRPHVYCSGSPKNFRINRANGLRISTFNTGGNSEIVGAVDPLAVKLDDLPPFIGSLT